MKLMQTATIPVPTGWTYSEQDGMPGIERTIAGAEILVAYDPIEDGFGKPWSWWVCPKGQGVSFARGEEQDMLSAIFAGLDALTQRLEE